MQLTGRTNKSALTRVLALVALLCAGALQVQEAGHWHEQDDSYTQCLVCKSAGSAALPSDVPAVFGNGAELADTLCLVPLLQSGTTRPFDARGPRHYS